MIRFDGITIDRKQRRIEHAGRACKVPVKLFPFACALLLAGPKGSREFFEIVYRKPSPPEACDRFTSGIVPRLRVQFAKIGIVIHAEQSAVLVKGKKYWAAAWAPALPEAAE